MNVAQKLALAVTTDVIVSLSSGARSLTFEAVRGRVDLENLKNNPYFDKEIGPQKHMVRLFATSLAGLGMDKMWRGLSAVGLSNVIDPQTNPLFKLISDYAKNTVNSTVGKVTSTVADLPFEGRAALNRVPSFFTMETLVWGNLQDVAMGRAKGVAVNASSSGLSNRFMIRLSDRNLSSRETSALEGLNR